MHEQIHRLHQHVLDCSPVTRCRDTQLGSGHAVVTSLQVFQLQPLLRSITYALCCTARFTCSVTNMQRAVLLALLLAGELFPQYLCATGTLQPIQVRRTALIPGNL
jgi:hypothetical protein